MICHLKTKMGLFNRNKEPKEKVTKETEPLEEESEDEEEFDEGICPYCGEWINSVEVKSLERKGYDDSVEVAVCPKCNKILGTLDF